MKIEFIFFKNCILALVLTLFINCDKNENNIEKVLYLNFNPTSSNLIVNTFWKGINDNNETISLYFENNFICSISSYRRGVYSHYLVKYYYEYIHDKDILLYSKKEREEKELSYKGYFINENCLEITKISDNIKINLEKQKL